MSRSVLGSVSTKEYTTITEQSGTTTRHVTTASVTTALSPASTGRWVLLVSQPCHVILESFHTHIAMHCKSKSERRVRMRLRIKVRMRMRVKANVRARVTVIVREGMKGTSNMRLTPPSRVLYY